MKLAPPRPLDGPPPRPGPKPSPAAAAAGVLPRPTVDRRGPAARRPRAARRLLRGIAVLFGVVGVLALTDGVLTLVWQEPVSGLLAHISQAQLAKSLNALEHQRPTAADEAALNGLPTDRQRMAYFARALQQTARQAQAVGKIVIPRIGANYVVVAGTSAAALRKGPGIYSGTSVPGLSGTVGIAGHRTTYLAPFRRINELTQGDLITLQMPYGVFTYTVTGHSIVAPNDISVLRPTGYDQVVLTACNPLYSASQRLAVFARLTSSVPTGFALSASVPQTPAATKPALVQGDFSESLLGGAPTIRTAPFPAVGSSLSGGQAGAILAGPIPAAARPAAKEITRPRTSTPPASVRSAAPAQPQAPVVAPAQQIAPRPTPVYVAPPQPVTISPVVRPRGPISPAKPTTSSPKTSSGDTTTGPPASSPGTPSAGQTQTRVQGQPGGPAPIIVTSG